MINVIGQCRHAVAAGADRGDRAWLALRSPQVDTLGYNLSSPSITLSMPLTTSANRS